MEYSRQLQLMTLPRTGHLFGAKMKGTKLIEGSIDVIELGLPESISKLFDEPNGTTITAPVLYSQMSMCDFIESESAPWGVRMRTVMRRVPMYSTPSATPSKRS